METIGAVHGFSQARSASESVNKEKLKKWGGFALAVIAVLGVVALVRRYVLPRAPAAVRKAADVVLPNV